jgi:hypothetical protein
VVQSAQGSSSVSTWQWFSTARRLVSTGLSARLSHCQYISVCTISAYSALSQHRPVSSVIALSAQVCLHSQHCQHSRTVSAYSAHGLSTQSALSHRTVSALSTQFELPFSSASVQSQVCHCQHTVSAYSAHICLHSQRSVIVQSAHCRPAFQHSQNRSVCSVIALSRQICLHRSISTVSAQSAHSQRTVNTDLPLQAAQSEQVCLLSHRQRHRTVSQSSHCQDRFVCLVSTVVAYSQLGPVSSVIAQPTSSQRVVNALSAYAHR